MFETIKNQLKINRDFKLIMKLTRAFIKKEKLYKVKISKKQIDLLMNLAMLGIKDDKQLSESIIVNKISCDTSSMGTASIIFNELSEGK